MFDWCRARNLGDGFSTYEDRPGLERPTIGALTWRQGVASQFDFAVAKLPPSFAPRNAVPMDAELVWKSTLWARRHAYPGWVLPNFHQAERDGALVLGASRFGAGKYALRRVPRNVWAAMGEGFLRLEARLAALQAYARSEGFAGAFPTYGELSSGLPTPLEQRDAFEAVFLPGEHFEAVQIDVAELR